ncbi:MAG: hypothetical protein IPN72_06945 [Saprospiraceae bacterium]|nr:hypothetical protein [Saprospiraceae bacterium]
MVHIRLKYLLSNMDLSIGKSNVSTGLEQGYALFVANGIKTEKLKLEIATAGGWALTTCLIKSINCDPIPKLKSFIDKTNIYQGFHQTNEIIENGGMNGDIWKKQQEAIENLHLYIIQLENSLTVLEQKLESKKGQ